MSEEVDPELVKDFLLFLDEVDDEIDAMPHWQTGKGLHGIMTQTGYPDKSCACRYYRDDHTRSTRCECAHDLDWHEGLRRCWYWN